LKVLFLYFILFFALLNTNGQNITKTVNIRGTWINALFLDCLRSCDSVEISASKISPRFLYVDSVNSLCYENHFEHISGEIKLTYQPKIKVYSFNSDKASYYKLTDDSTLVLSSRDTIRAIYKKINIHATPGSGMQIYFRNYFFDNEINWELIHFHGSGLIDTQRVTITATRILDINRKYITQFEFMDTYQTSVNNKMLFNIMFFDEDKNYMSINERLFALRKDDDKVLLYKKETLEYILIPVITNNAKLTR
jgi:hypothetical protein